MVRREKRKSKLNVVSRRVLFGISLTNVHVVTADKIERHTIISINDS